MSIQDALNRTGPKVPFTPVLTDSEVKASLSRQDVLIAKIEPLRVRIANGLDKAEKFAAGTAPLVGLFAPQALPFIAPATKSLDLIEGLLRSNFEFDDTTLTTFGDVLDGWDKALNPATPEHAPDAPPNSPSAESPITAANTAALAHGHTDTTHHTPHHHV